MTFPGIWGGRERIDVGPTGRTLGFSPPTPTLQPLWRNPLATIFGDASRSRGLTRDCNATGMSIPRLPVPWRTPVRHRSAESRRGPAFHGRGVSLGLQL